MECSLNFKRTLISHLVTLTFILQQHSIGTTLIVTANIYIALLNFTLIRPSFALGNKTSARSITAVLSPPGGVRLQSVIDQLFIMVSSEARVQKLVNICTKGGSVEVKAHVA